MFFRRTFRSDPGNKVIECGGLTLMVSMGLFLLIKFDAPGWLFACGLMLVVVLCFTTLFFVAQRAWRAMHRRVERRQSEN
jgi:ABC-type transport system involved in Fe-S cluster assembly fused permease/ATPase subunit